MIKKIIEEFAINHGYKRVDSSSNAIGYDNQLSYLIQVNGDKKRFLALYESKALTSPQELNNIVNNEAPEVFKSDPAFEKNTDLIVLHNLEHRADFKEIETKVFSIEENPYYFKKYFLYFSDAELSLLEDHDINSLLDVVTNEKMFSEYKESPLEPSLYSVAARILIKVPFIKVPIKEGDLKPIQVYLDEALIEDNVHELYEKIIQQKNNDAQPDEIIRSLISEEMENS